jgi:hypothetical protein
MNAPGADTEFAEALKARGGRVLSLPQRGLA